MTEKERIEAEIEPILKEITRTLAAFKDANALKQGLIYKSELKGRTFTLTFTEDHNASRTHSLNMGETTPIRVD